MRSSKSCIKLLSSGKFSLIVLMAEDKWGLTSGSWTTLSLMLSLWEPKPFLLVVTRDTASDERVASRSRKSLIAFPFSIELRDGWFSEPTGETAPDVADSAERRDRDWDGSMSRVSLLSDLEKDLLRCGFEECFRELSTASYTTTTG
jgi:hypothetical protein